MGRFNDNTATLTEGRDPAVGETRTVFAKDKGGEIIKTIHVTRTNREYVYDLADAYNRAMPDVQRRMGLEWFVLPSGELKLGEARGYSEHRTRELEREREQERRRWIANHRERADAA